MPDAHFLYMVAAIVVLGLTVWVSFVLIRAPKDAGTPPLARAATAGPAHASPTNPPVAAPMRAAASTASSPSPTSARSPRLDAHAEIQDSGLRSSQAGGRPEDEEEEPTGPHALILVTAVGRTDPGLRRSHNEDAYATLEDHHLFVIADGMGRHAAGEVASQLCVDAIAETFNSGNFGVDAFDPSLPKRANRIRGAIIEANTRIFIAARDHEAYYGMGTTVVATYFSPNNQRAYIAHVGDSRCYRFRAGKLLQLTTDHTLGAAGIQGKSAGVLSRAVGVEDRVDVEISVESPLPEDIYLLCSDGLSRMVQHEEIQQIIESSPQDLDVATKKLIDMANERGGRDNITTILVRVDDAKLRMSPKPTA